MKLIEIDKKTGKLKLSKKAMTPRPAGSQDRAPQSAGNDSQNAGSIPQRKVPTENQD